MNSNVGWVLKLFIIISTFKLVTKYNQVWVMGHWRMWVMRFNQPSNKIVQNKIKDVWKYQKAKKYIYNRGIIVNACSH
jgi:hypothetical protein